MTIAAAHPPDVQTPNAVALAELNAAFDLYEDALVHNQVAMLDLLFWDSPHTLRYGAKDRQYGYDEIKAFRASRPGVGLNRSIVDRHVVTFGSHMGVANITYARSGEPRTGRQSQTWVKFDSLAEGDVASGWRVVAAHVSWMDL